MMKPFSHKYKIRKGSITHDLLTFTMRVIGWLLHLKKYQGSSQLLLELQRLNDQLKRISADRGVVGLIEFLKQTRLGLLHFLSGEHSLKKVPGVKLEANGCPSILKRVMEIIMKEGAPTLAMSLGIRALTTLLFSSRALSKGKIPKLSDISDSPKVSHGVEGDWVKSFWRELGFNHKYFNKIPKAITFKKYHFSMKSGPNGPALASSIADLSLIKDNPRLRQSLEIVGGKELKARMDGLIEQLDFLKFYHPRYPEISLRKLSYFPDKELKVRVVAILDYWSQASLFPLHCWLYRILRRIPQDTTFDQGSFRDKIRGWDRFYSIDLTAATDRFPIAVIKLVLGVILPKDYLDAWEYIMVGLPFKFKYQGHVTDVSYGTGTPMGSYTSWASFALAHHAIIYLACVRANLDWKSAKYCLLGDDLLIGDDALARHYKEIIKGLGVEFSPLKTHESPNLCEFAKRLIWNGEEITPFPISALKESSKYYNLLPVLYGENRKSWGFGEELWRIIESYYSYVKGFNSSTATKIGLKAMVAETLMLYIRGLRSATDCLKAVYRQSGKPAPEELDNITCEGVIRKCLLEVFQDSDPSSEKNKKVKSRPLGELASYLTTALTSGDDSQVIWACDNISRVPILNVYGQVSEMYITLKKQSWHNLKMTGVWPLFLKTYGLPLSDQCFVSRQQDRLAKGASQAAFKLIKEVESVLAERKKLLGKTKVSPTMAKTMGLFRLVAKAASKAPPPTK